MDLVINDIEIGRNDAGLYSINDLHKAAGNSDSHKPVYFFRSENTKRFMAELEKVTDSHLLVNRVAGRHGGTWVSALLVYKYAAWVNPEFDVRVFKTFEALRNGDADKVQALLSNDKAQLKIIDKRDRLMRSKIPAGKKADKLVLLEREWNQLGTDASKCLSVRRGQSFKFEEAQEKILNDIQSNFEF